jgi:glucokinase
MSKEFALGIDIGGTNTVYGAVSENGEILFEASTPTTIYTTPEELINFIYKETIQKIDISNCVGIGVGAPNGNHFTGNIEYAPNLQWKGIIPLASLFEQKFDIKCKLTNDANAAAVGEMLFGCAKNLKNFVTITLGTGLGSGVIINGEIVYGQHGIAGEYGHIRVIPNGRMCGCERKGCLETYASSTGMVRSINELESPNKQNSKLLQVANCDAKMIFQIAEEGDLFAQEIIDYTAEILGSALADFTCFSDPQAYVLFGGIAQAGEKFSTLVKKHMEANVLKIYENKVEILTSKLHDKNAAVLGAAASMFLKHRKKAQL